MNLDNYLSLKESDAIRYDFLKEPYHEPDNCKLIKEIYNKLFKEYPWYTNKNFSGETICTYRTAIKFFYKKPYSRVDRYTQKEILTIIKKYTKKDDNQIFELKKLRPYRESSYKVYNNYQLGNFCTFPVSKPSLNVARSYFPYNDFFDKYLTTVFDYYSTGLLTTPDSNLKKAMLTNQQYFEYFKNFDDYINKNYFQDFLENGKIINLSSTSQESNSETQFGDYVKKATSIISKRSERIWIELHENSSVI